jgi:cell division protease FtsH
MSRNGATAREIDMSMHKASGRSPSTSDAGRTAGRRQAMLLCALALPFLIGVYALVLGYWARPASTGQELRLDQFLDVVAKNRVGSATILAADDRVIGTYDGRYRYWVDFSGGHETLFARITGALEQAGVPTNVQSQPLKSLVQPVSMLLPMLILADVMVLLALVAKGGGQLGGFGRAGARQIGDGEPTITFADLAGADEAVEELAEIRDYLAEPSRFAHMGAAVPKGVLLSGPPGCGKTRLARAVAGESAVPFFSISGSDFVEMYVGVGAARIRDLFATAKAAAPSIVFIDEIDAVGRARSTSAIGANDEREATLNQLLVEMDGFGADSGVVVMAATNRPDILDTALLRPGRFDRRITLDPPDLKGRAAILAIHAGHKPLGPDVDLASIASQTAGFSGADLANVVNEAALLATRRQATAIAAADLTEAVERVVAGPQRHSRILTPADKARVAVHEAGHAVVAASQGSGGVVTKVSLVARGHAQGSMVSAPGGDRILATRSELCDRIAVLLGGRAAEELELGQPSTGSNDDLARATELARRMVTECGMSDELGPLAFTSPANSEDVGRSWSETTAAKIDEETERIVRAAWATATSVLLANRPALASLADELVSAETVEGPPLAALLAGVVPQADAGLWTELTAIAS